MHASAPLTSGLVILIILEYYTCCQLAQGFLHVCCITGLSTAAAEWVQRSIEPTHQLISTSFWPRAQEAKEPCMQGVNAQCPQHAAGWFRAYISAYIIPFGRGKEGRQEGSDPTMRHGP